MGFDVTCPSDGECSAWVFQYFHDCVCNTRDKVSFGLGLASIFSWGVAEIPQIIANWKAGSSEHVSFAFILTWTIGDLFNLTGCYLTPETLPTQFYTALLYTLTTLVLVFQHIWFTWLKPKSSREEALKAPLVENEEGSRSQGSLEGLFPSDPSLADGTTIPGDGKTRLARTRTAPIPSSNATRQRNPQPSGNSYSYGSYRRMTMSPSLHSVGTVMMITTGVQLVASPLLGGAPGGYGEVLSGGGFSGRKLLHAGYGSFAGQSSIFEPEVSSTVGLLMGWAMTAIYLMGRLPQILLNIRRGSVEGLSMSMFVFAITGNATYLGSILVRSGPWSELGPNLPWLVDAACCLAMDLVILGQFVWYKAIRKQSNEASEGS